MSQSNRLAVVQHLKHPKGLGPLGMQRYGLARLDSSDHDSRLCRLKRLDTGQKSCDRYVQRGPVAITLVSHCAACEDRSGGVLRV